MKKTIKIFFIGRKQGILTAKNFPQPKNMPWMIENERPGERDGFLQAEGVERTYSLKKADVIFVRNMPERTKAHIFKRIERKVNKFRDGKLVINDTTAFHNFSHKDSTFQRWQETGIPCPECIRLDMSKQDADLVFQIRDFLKKHGEIYVRTNNEERGRGIEPLAESASDDDVLNCVKTMRHLQKNTPHGDTDIIMVEKIKAYDADGYTNLFRAHVVLGKVVSGYALSAKRQVIHTRDLKLEEFDRFVEANTVFNSQICRSDENRQKIVDAVTALGCNIGAAEFFLINGEIQFLEVNPMWGHVLHFGGKEYCDYIIANKEKYHTDLSNIYHWLDRVNYYKAFYEQIAEEARKLQS